MHKDKPVKYLEVTFDDKAHEETEQVGRKRLTAENGKVLYALRGGILKDGKWAHKCVWEAENWQ